jgi:hypothetical protein
MRRVRQSPVRMCYGPCADCVADSGENAKLLRQLHKKFIERLT